MLWRCSAPRIWNQGKASVSHSAISRQMLRSANLESRQSCGLAVEVESDDAPLREFGIKAKQQNRRAHRARRCSAPRIWNQGKAVLASCESQLVMLRSANLESRQSRAGEFRPTPYDAPLREFGIKAKHAGRCWGVGRGCSAPRIWNQGKAKVCVGKSRRRMLRSANLESRQSGNQANQLAADDAPLREFGIKAKPSATECAGASRCSAPRIWNQGKATVEDKELRIGMLRSANLESRQSVGGSLDYANWDAPLREFGIKAKHWAVGAKIEVGCSAPRIWNQGKARASTSPKHGRMLRSANLESRQSAPSPGAFCAEDAPLREFGIKAKQRSARVPR
mgnify:CR=1 FL=1